MIYVVLQHQKKNILLQLLKKAASLNSNFTWHQKTATKAVKEIKQKPKQACQEDMKKTWRRKPLHRRYPQRAGNSDADKATAHQWLSSSSMKGETEGLILAAQDQSIPTTTGANQESLKMGLTTSVGYVQTTKRL